ncbi:MAG: hypothetical protein HFI70_12820 [Lachnospiraceae bacterium]|nr:hypothetical protein [Lachnospiraceae bacterium]
MQMYTKSSEFKLDQRNTEDIVKEIADLAQSYVPEWKFDAQNPDIGSTLALLFAEQMESGIRKFNRLLEQFQIEFVNMLDISLLPVHPSEALVLFCPSAGTWLNKGTRMSAEGEEKNIQFRNSQGCYLTDSRLTHCFEAEGGTGVMIPVLGNFPQTAYFAEDDLTGEESFRGNKLFVFPERGIERHALLLGHEHIFDIANDKIYIKFCGGENLAERIINEEFRLLYPSCQGMQRAEKVKLQGEILVIERNLPVLPYLVIEAVQAPKDVIVLEDILVSSEGKSRQAVYAGNGNIEFDVDKFCPFGDKLQLFDECYIGDDNCFSKKNAWIQICFEVSFAKQTVGLDFFEPEEDLRIIKRKPPFMSKQRLAETAVEEISFEYFNGQGWKRLVLEQDCSRMFASARQGTYKICFWCPPDWKSSQSGSFQGRCIRMRLMKADHCYFLPCRHIYPVLEHLEISFSYMRKYERPLCLERFYENEKIDLAREWKGQKKVTVFAPPRHEKHTLYLGFDKKMEYGPVNLYFEFASSTGRAGTKLCFEYSGKHGFRSMQVWDGTEGFLHTGIVSVAAPEDFTERKELGVSRYWIRIRDEYAGSEQRELPFLKQVSVNGVLVQNIEFLEEEEFYIEQVRPNMVFSLSEKYIVDADIWVNEKDTCPMDQREEMLREHPEQVRAEYDLMGNIQDFYVKWQETGNFEYSYSGGRYYILDRARGQVRFGDGVHVNIPQVTDSTAFLAAVRVSEGAAGNVPADTIRDFVSNTEFQGTFTNPLPAFGGTDQENIFQAVNRGMAWFGSQGRLLTRADFIQELKGYSENIDKVSLVAGQTPEGKKDPGHICLVVMMKDFAKGSRSFQKEAEGMEKYLYSRCEMTVEKGKLSIVQPVPVQISVELWLEDSEGEERFEIERKMTNMLQKFLNPVGDAFQEGWKIGILPRKTQILMSIHAAFHRIHIRHMTVTGRYQYQGEIFERELERIPQSSFFICQSGRHKVHVLSQEEI